MLTPAMHYSDNGLALTEGFESLRLSAYQDVKGVWTIGYGHTGDYAHAGATIDEPLAILLLKKDVALAEWCVNTYCKVPVTQNEFDALVDFTFNVGNHAFANSTLLKKLNALDNAGAATEFQAWVYSGGNMINGLKRRRDAEERLFLA